MTKGVENELTGPRKSDSETRAMATKAESLLKRNDSIEAVTQTRADSAGSEQGYGEQSIEDYIFFGEHDVATVFFFDDDMDDIIENLADKTDFFIFSKIVSFSAFGLSQQEQIEEVLKIAKGRGWTSKRNLADLLVETGIMSRTMFNFSRLRQRIDDEISSDL